MMNDRNGQSWGPRVACALLVLSLAWAADAALGLGVFAIHDLKHHHLPWRVWAASEWAAGRVPLWAPAIGNGFPMLAEGQTGVLYPPTMLLFVLFPATTALNWTLILHTWWAGLGMWFFLRALGRSPAGSVVGAVAFAFSGFMASHALYLGMQNAVAWLPWLLTSVVQKRWPFAGLCAWMMLVAGHPQAAVIGLLLSGVFAVHQAWVASSKQDGWRRLPWGYAVAMGLALCAASAQVLASLELSEMGMRGGGVEAAFAHIGGLPPQELIGAVLPQFFGIDRPGDIVETYYHRGDGYWGSGVNHWEMCFYLGIPVVLLALVSLRRERFWWVIVAGSVVLMLGGMTPAWDMLRSLPGLGFFRFPVRFSLCLTLAFAVLASRGFDDLLAMEEFSLRWWIRRFLALGGLAVLALGLLGLSLHLGEATVRQKLHGHFMGQVEPPPIPDDLDPLQAAALPEPEPEDPDAIPGKVDRIVESLEQNTRPWSSRVWLPLGFVLAVAFVLARREQLGRHRAGFAIVGLVYLDLWIFGANYLERVAPEDAGLHSDTVSVMGEGVSAWRSTVVDRRQDPSLDGSLMSASLGLLHGTRDVIVTSPLLILRNEALLAAVGLDVGDKGTVKLERLAAHPEIVDLLGIRWLLSVHDLTELGYSRLNDATAPVGVYENADSLPLGFLVGCARMADTPFDEVLSLDPKQSAIVESVTQLPDCDNGARAGRVSRVELSPTEVRFETVSENASLLVDNETWYPGWEAEIDGEPAPVLKTNLVFRGVELTGGTHAVVMRYRPTWAPLALGLSAIGGMGLLGWGIWRRRRQA